MSSLTITLSESTKVFVKAQAEKEGYRSSSEYVKSLVEEVKLAKLKESIDKKLLAAIEGLDRGEGVEITPEDWERKRERIRRQIKTSKS